MILRVKGGEPNLGRVSFQRCRFVLETRGTWTSRRSKSSLTLSLSLSLFINRSIDRSIDVVVLGEGIGSITGRPRSGSGGRGRGKPLAPEAFNYRQPVETKANRGAARTANRVALSLSLSLSHSFS